MKHFLIIILSIMCTPHAFAEWKNATELSSVVVGGNSSSETTNLKQETTYKWEKNSVNGKGNYTESKQDNTLSAQNWTATLKYERLYSDKLSAFLAQGAESNTFAGYTQRDNTDLGLKYTLFERKIEGIKDPNKWFVEAGIRSLTTNFVDNSPTTNTTNLRIYTEANKTFKKDLTGKFWVEYISDSEDSELYYVNAEPSISMSLTNIFSLKVSYLLKYQNTLPTGITERLDTTFSTALVATY